MACAAPPSPLPVVSLPARRRSATAVAPASYHAPSTRFSRRSWLSSGNSPRSRLRTQASKAEPAEEGVPAAPGPSAPSEPLPQPRTSIWNWKGYNIRYQYAGTSGPALVLIHGFGANRCAS
ncbi:unnamed protein product [Triticum turgidum subsp. durum]|uniref:Chlorophyllase n=1 Tax=Triticum turgidum subsp. durum TaxID=4567 RepID=A0A9R1PJ59_TRITD|nr:unnamed protein product [Triticum turgidum subsp. durum]